MQAPILRFASASRVIALVGEKLLGSRHGGQHQRRALEVAHLASAEQHHERSSGQINFRFGVVNQNKLLARLLLSCITRRSPIIGRIS